MDFLPYGDSLHSLPELLWLRITTDALLAGAYILIPIFLWQVARKRTDVRINWTLIAFAAFLFTSAASHLISILGIWKPWFVEAEMVQPILALLGIASALCLKALRPSLVSLPSRDQLKAADAALAKAQEQLEKCGIRLAENDAALKSINDAHNKSETQFRQLADSMPQIVWTAGPDGNIDYYNERWYSFTGFERDFLGDQSWMRPLHPEDVQRRYKSWYASVRSGLPFKEEYRLFDRSTGTYRWHLGRASPIKDDNGKVTKWFGACTDIDDYKRSEAAVLSLNSQLENRVLERTEELTRANEHLRQTQTWMQAILQSATDVSIMALDNNGVIVFFNSGSERLLGYKADDLVGKCTPYMLYPPEQCAARARQLSNDLGREVPVDEIFLAANQPSSSIISESVYLHRDGTPIDISLATSPMIDPAGERLGKLAIAVDRRPQRALEQQLKLNNIQFQEQSQRAEEANRAKSNFLSTISHEIRTPMNAILGMADLLWESELADQQRRYVEVFRRACTSLLSLVNDILDVSKIESGKFELEQIDFDLYELLEISLDMARAKLAGKKIRLDLRIEPETPNCLLGDPARLQQVLGNLISNAVKFTERGSVTIKVASNPEDPHRLCFEVSDTGIGIPPDKLESIFQDFIQAEASTTRRFGGTGLGLGICRRLVHRMGGELRVKSALGQGSTFSFDALFAAGSEKDLSRSSLVANVSGSRVLIVDENKTNRLIFVEMCRAWGMETAECAMAEEVLPTLQHAAANKRHFQLVIIDRVISERDGEQLASRIRLAYHHLPILMTTSDNIPGDQTRMRYVGVTEYAVKPVRRPELLRLVCKLLASADQLAADAGAKAASPDKVEEKPPLRILIAEDSEDNRFLLNEYLKLSNFQVTFAENGKIAVDLFKVERFDFVLMDVQMPVMDGLTAARLIRETERLEGRKPIPLLALTANAYRNDLELSRAAGCDAHISKPISRQEMLLLIKNYTSDVATPVAPADPPAAVVGVVVNVPKGLEEPAKRYIRSRRTEVGQINDLLKAKDFTKIKTLAHNMKGTGGAYGFPDLTRLGRLIEAAAKEGDGDALSQQLLELAKSIDQMAEIVLQEAPV